MARRSPQEKKALSYARDRRNDYGENDKSSRKNIRHNKRTPNRSDRHRERRILNSATGAICWQAVHDTETALHAKKSMWMTKRWRKHRDAPLGSIVARTLRRRIEQGMADSASAKRRFERVRRRTRSLR